jgi:glycosyltransferase involved in cell wall biosynthesis
MLAPVRTPPSLFSILVPVYNEGATVRAVLQRLSEIPLPLPREIIAIDDGSTDNTRAVLDEAGRSGSVRVIHAEANGGKGSAIRLGLAEARGDIVGIQDADLELDPAQLATLILPIIRGEAAVVYGSRFLAGQPRAPAATLLANYGLTALTNLLFGARLTDMETCYKVMRTDVARSLALRARRFDIEPEITAKLLRAGHRIVELPVKFEPRSRAAGKKIRWRDGIHAVATLLRYRFGS